MSLKCNVGLHSWKGCMCSACGKIRDKEHLWANDCNLCSICGHTRDEGHQWNTKDCAACTVCGKKAPENHIWEGCKCTTCGKTRDEGHRWDTKDCAVCRVCGKNALVNHTWNGCKCTTCSKTRDEGHQWIQPELCKCAMCGKTRTGPKENNSKGYQFLNNRDFDQALQCFDNSLSIDARNEPALVGKGLVFYLAGKYQQSVEELNRALSIDAANNETHWYLARAYDADPAFRTNAIEAYDQVLEDAKNEKIDDFRVWFARQRKATINEIVNLDGKDSFYFDQEYLLISANEPRFRSDSLFKLPSEYLDHITEALRSARTVPQGNVFKTLDFIGILSYKIERELSEKEILSIRFINSLERKDFEAAVEYFKEGADVNARLENGNNLFAFIFDYISYVPLNEFLDAGLDVKSACTYIGEYPLYLSIVQSFEYDDDRLKTIGKMISKGADVNKGRTDGRCIPLLCAIERCNPRESNFAKYIALAELLMKHSADTSLREEKYIGQGQRGATTAVVNAQELAQALGYQEVIRLIQKYTHND
jgi:tetratricopeptide (TPR) repeat protein